MRFSEIVSVLIGRRLYYTMRVIIIVLFFAIILRANVSAVCLIVLKCYLFTTAPYGGKSVRAIYDLGIR